MAQDGSFVVVANRLPVDEVTDGEGEVALDNVARADGRLWRRSPGGLVTALHPILAANRGTWVGWAGAAGPAPAPFEVDGIRLHPVAADRPGGRGVLRGPVQRHHLAALPRRRRDPGVPPALARGLPRGEPALRRGHRRVAPPGCDGLGAGLPATAGAGDAARAPPRPAHRLLPAHPVPADRAVHAAARREEIIRGLLGADLVGFQTPLGAQNFLHLAHHLLGLRRRGLVGRGRTAATVRAGSFPVSIDVERDGGADRHPARCGPGPRRSGPSWAGPRR